MIDQLIKELADMGFPEEMANKMASKALKQAGMDSKSIQNTLPAFYIDDGNIILIDTSIGIK